MVKKRVEISGGMGASDGVWHWVFSPKNLKLIMGRILKNIQKKKVRKNYCKNLFYLLKFIYFLFYLIFLKFILFCINVIFVFIYCKVRKSP
jgi:hypothetical protein